VPISSNYASVKELKNTLSEELLKHYQSDVEDFQTPIICISSEKTIESEALNNFVLSSLEKGFTFVALERPKILAEEKV
jgi:hypothetical protein